MTKPPIKDLPENTVFMVGGAHYIKHYGGDYLFLKDPTQRVWKENVEAWGDDYVLVSSPVFDKTPGDRDKPQERTITITISETVVYEREFTVFDLEAMTGKSLNDDFGGNAQEFVEYIQEYGSAEGSISQMIERHGDVQGQVWTGVLMGVDRT